MELLLIALGLDACVGATLFLIFAEQRTALQEIEALVVLLISAVLFVGGAVLGHGRREEKDSLGWTVARRGARIAAVLLIAVGVPMAIGAGAAFFKYRQATNATTASRVSVAVNEVRTDAPKSGPGAASRLRPASPRATSPRR